MNDIKVRNYKDLYISSSNIQGKGLFTNETIKSGEVILSFGGVLALLSERYSGKYMNSSFAGLTDEIIICELKESHLDLSDYINHSCSPNIGMDDCLTIVAIKDIKKGSELLCDYSFWEADSEWSLNCECNCGSPNCRKKITGEDWKNIKSSSRNFKFCSPFIQRRILYYEKGS